jgi:4-carboxymuconolactone decarboxylase
MQMSVYAGFPAALNGLAAVKEVFGAEGIGVAAAGLDDAGFARLVVRRRGVP